MSPGFPEYSPWRQIQACDTGEEQQDAPEGQQPWHQQLQLALWPPAALPQKPEIHRHNMSWFAGLWRVLCPEKQRLQEKCLWSMLLRWQQCSKQEAAAAMEAAWIVTVQSEMSRAQNIMCHSMFSIHCFALGNDFSELSAASLSFDHAAVQCCFKEWLTSQASAAATFWLLPWSIPNRLGASRGNAAGTLLPPSSERVSAVSL